MSTLKSQYKNFLKLNINSNLSFEQWEKINGRLIKQALINMMKEDEDLGLYDETTKCYCGHTTTCDCEPEEPEQETLEEASEKILANNIDGLKDALKDDDLFFFYKDVIKCYGEAMAKWQQDNFNINALDFEINALKKEIKLLKYQHERSYSEEDMIDYSNYRLLIKKALDPKKWFEQFKNK